MKNQSPWLIDDKSFSNFLAPSGTPFLIVPSFRNPFIRLHFILSSIPFQFTLSPIFNFAPYVPNISIDIRVICVTSCVNFTGESNNCWIYLFLQLEITLFWKRKNLLLADFRNKIYSFQCEGHISKCDGFFRNSQLAFAFCIYL